MANGLENPNRANLKPLFSKTGVLFSVMAIVMFIASSIIFPPFPSQFNMKAETQGCMGCDTDDDDGEISVTPVKLISKNLLPPALDYLDVSFHSPIDGIQSPPDFPPKATPPIYL